ncbi:ParB/RepB/Spo0J family partition protein [Proteiniclasticum sp.]|jgi:ParB family chromosome partitioning protein|uniref:ParB/RepB/Spo0J family partition protein n=1 Tax=Proteiniclasticum sp. TaxID=2053595 RepID=UPI000E8DCF13|nr:ParB/RepB/Spo0J family partition protein [Proteiniclasticum sp.]HBW12388.1 chromosome partitioning protein ParB [Proteiniclasticum sp.]
MAKKFGLGKGLNQLIPEEEEIITVLNINKIKANKKQPRKYFDEEKLVLLSESIKEHGMIQPIIVQKDGEDYSIIAGERRWRAAKKASLKEVPVIVMDIADSTVLEVSLIENIQRQDLNPIEEASAFKRLIHDFKLTQEDLAKKIGKSRTSIANTMRLIQLDERVQQFLIEESLSEGHGRALLGLESSEDQYLAAQKVIDEGLSVRETERLVTAFHKVKPVARKMKLDPYYKDIEKRLAKNMGTKVLLKPKAKNKGKIEIEYYSMEDLNRLLEYLRLEE